MERENKIKSTVNDLDTETLIEISRILSENGRYLSDG